MVQLRIYTPQTRTMTPNIGHASVQQPMANVSNTAMSRALHDGLGLAKGVVDMYAQEEAKQKELQLATDILAASEVYEQASFAFERDYTDTHKGKDARATGNDYMAWHSEARAKAREQFADNPKAQYAFDQYLSRSSQSSIQRGFSYGDAQDTVYRQDTVAARWAGLSQFAASTDDMVTIERRRIEVQRETSALLPDRDLTADFAAKDVELWSNVINTRLAKGDLNGARAVLSGKRAELGMSYDDAVGKVKAEEKRVQDAAQKNYVRQASDAYVAQFGDDLDGMLAHVKEKEKDPDVRVSIEQNVKSQWSFNQSRKAVAEKQALKDDRDSRLDMLNSANPAEAAAIISEAPLENQPVLNAHYNRRTTGNFHTDPMKKSELHQQIIMGENVDFEDYRPFISPHEMQDLEELNQNTQRKNMQARAKKRFDAQFTATRLGGKKEERDAFKDQLELEYLEFLQDPKVTTDEQVDTWLFKNLSSKTIKDGGFMGWFDKDVDALTARKLEEKDNAENYVAIPKAHRDVVVSQLQASGLLDGDGELSDMGRERGFLNTSQLLEKAYLKNRERIALQVREQNAK